MGACEGRGRVGAARPLIYLDNAATCLKRPPVVAQAVVDAMGSMGNAGRGASAEARGAAGVVWACRQELARLFGCPAADHVCFTANSTEALNIAICGLLPEGGRAVSTVLEHNSVLRPLNRLVAERGCSLELAGCDALGRLDYGDLARACAGGCDLVACTHASNVTGNPVDVARVAQIAHAAGAVLVVDASQSAGAAEIDMAAMGIDVLCFTGHKGLMGPQGTGGLAVMPGIEVAPLLMGGTGVHSFDPLQPLDWPTRLEAGTLNAHGIAGLLAAVRYIDSVGGVRAVGSRERSLARRFFEQVRVPGVELYGDLEAPGRTGVVSLNIEGMSSAEASDILMADFGVATRPGAHCAPLMHRALGTAERGAVRFSFGYLNDETEADAAADAVRALV